MNLAERCDYLEEENRQLRAMLRGSDDARFPAQWRLSAGEKRILRSLISSIDGFRTSEALHAVGSLSESTSENLVPVLVCNLRKKLRPFGVEIHTIWGQGYKIDQRSKGIVTGARTKEVMQ